MPSHFSVEEILSCKNFMKLDPNEDDPNVELVMLAAESYLKTGGAYRPGNPVYVLAFNALALHFYDHRDDIAAATGIPAGLRILINQLKTDPVPEPEVPPND